MDFNSEIQANQLKNTWFFFNYYAEMLFESNTVKTTAD